MQEGIKDAVEIVGGQAEVTVNCKGLEAGTRRPGQLEQNEGKQQQDTVLQESQILWGLVNYFYYLQEM